MSKSAAFLNRVNLLLVIAIVFTTLLIGCRKDPKIPSPAEEQTLNLNNTWRKISNDAMREVNTLAVVSNELYIGGEFNDTVNGITFLAKMNKSNQFSPVFNYPISGTGVYDIKGYTPNLFVGGDFTVIENGVLHKNLLMLNGQNISFNDLSTSSSEYIDGFNYLLGDFVAFGKFEAGGTNSATTANVEKLNGAGQPLGYSSTTGSVFSIVSHLNETYACGPQIGLIKKASLFWAPVNYIGKLSSDKIYAVESNGYELLMFGKFQDGVQLKIRYNSGAWANVTEVKQVGTITSRNKIVRNGDDLILCGSHLQLNGKNRSNVLVFDGFNWRAMGDLKVEVRDIIFFNSTYYAATNDGVYVYED